jgi:hypothetical protein
MDLTKESVSDAIKEAINSFHRGNLKPVAESYNKEEGITTNVFLTSLDLYVKVVAIDDSYGGNDRIISISLVDPVTQSVTNYE